MSGGKITELILGLNLADEDNKLRRKRAGNTKKVGGLLSAKLQKAH
jgi:hypothetical protein